MVQPRQQPRLALETLHRRRIGACARLEDFEDDGLIQIDVMGQPDAAILVLFQTVEGPEFAEEQVRRIHRPRPSISRSFICTQRTETPREAAVAVRLP